MAIIFNNGEDPSEVIYNGVSVERVVFNGEIVWEAYRKTIVLDYDNDIPQYIKTRPTVPSSPLYDIKLWKDSCPGTMNNGSDPLDLGRFELGFTNDSYPNPDTYYGDFIPVRRQDTIIDVTRYRTCSVESILEGILQNVQFFNPVGQIVSHNYGFFTMMNNDELNQFCGNWRPVSQGSSYYWYDTQSLFPRDGNNLKYQDYDSVSDEHDPNHQGEMPNKPEWWSYVPYNIQLGYAFHIWAAIEGYGNGYGGPGYGGNGYGFGGPNGFDENAYYSSHYSRNLFGIEAMRYFGQPVKFSVENLTGNRVIRCLLLPSAITGTGHTSSQDAVVPNPQSSGSVRIYKVTLETTKLIEPED